MATYNRISARRGQPVALDATFYQGGQPADPYAIHRIEIFRGRVTEDNIVAAFDITPPGDTSYPYPLTRQPDPPIPQENCPTPPDCEDTTTPGSDPGVGRYRLLWDVPNDLVVPDVYFDVWYFYATDPGTEDLTQLLKQCNRFWVYPDNWYVDGGLETIRLGFEPLDIKFRKPEVRPLEIGIMPLPLYDYNYNLVAPILPYLNPTISVWTENGEAIVSNAQCSMKLRQGAYRSNPWVISYQLDTCRYFKGTYKYRVKVVLPDGTSRVSGDYYFTVS